jgi:hypothetical protein
MLHGDGLEPGADFREQRIAIIALDAIDAHLDQLVRLQAAVDLGQDGFAEAVLADAGDRIAGLWARARSGAALGWGKFDRH